MAVDPVTKIWPMSVSMHVMQYSREIMHTGREFLCFIVVR